ncbi:hypothetical protein Hdeb2414_s0020g00562961 [Helianthus debilis subsp. tardiflorus]
MDPVLNSIVAKGQFCYIAALHDEHANLNNTFVLLQDDGDKSIHIISYGAMFSLYKSNLQCEFSGDSFTGIGSLRLKGRDPRDFLNGNEVRLLI